jgi:hypothetical protein
MTQYAGPRSLTVGEERARAAGLASRSGARRRPSGARVT